MFPPFSTFVGFILSSFNQQFEMKMLFLHYPVKFVLLKLVIKQNFAKRQFLQHTNTFTHCEINGRVFKPAGIFHYWTSAFPVKLCNWSLEKFCSLLAVCCYLLWCHGSVVERSTRNSRVSCSNPTRGLGTFVSLGKILNIASLDSGV